MIPDWITKLMQLAKPVLPKDFVGQVEVNIFKGGITNVNVRQSYKEETENASNRTRAY